MSQRFTTGLTVRLSGCPPALHNFFRITTGEASCIQDASVCPTAGWGMTTTKIIIKHLRTDAL